jgi:radical SAM superfamily enzyme YgiQ (UPF0313 family)
MSKPAAVDVVFVNPGDRRQVYQTLGTSLAAIEPPIWVGLLAGFSRARGLRVEVIDANAEALSPEETAARVDSMVPSLAVVVAYGHNPSASTQVMPAAGAVCHAIKAADPVRPILLLGGHVAALPEQTLRGEAADFVGYGEGFQTVVDLVAALQAGDDGLARVPGLLYREEAGFRRTAPESFLRSLDAAVPAMPWDLFPMDRYRAHNWHCFGHLDRRAPYASLYTTLGCPYRCSYCCIQAPFKSAELAAGYKPEVNTYRYWSPDWVLAQVDTLVTRYGIRNLKFADEMFVLNPKHVLGICDRFIERGYDLNIWAYARVDTTKEAMLDRLKRAGFNWFCFGFEAGSERVRNDVNKRFDQDEVFRVAERVRAAGIHIIGNYIFGLPEDDLASMQETLDLALDLNCEFANFYSAMAYPGSELYRTALKECWPLPKSWSGYSQHAVDTLPLPTRYLSGPEVLRFRDQAFDAYFHAPRYLDRVTQLFGPETAEHIRTMAAIRLERQPESIGAGSRG